LPESLTRSPVFSNYAIAVYSSLKVLSGSIGMSKQCVTPYQLMYLLTKNEHPHKYMLNYIKCGLDELIKENVLVKINEVQKHYIIDCSKLWVDTNSEKFTIIAFQEIEKIFRIENVNNFLLLRYFIYLIGSLSSKIDVWLDACQHKSRVVGMLTLDQLSNLSGISVRSIIDYNKILEESELIYIHRQNDFVLDKENNIKQLPNVYGRNCDRLYIDAFADNQKNFNGSYHYVEKNIVNVNNNRRLAQMYQQLLKGKGENYSKSEILDIYNYVIAENKKYMNTYEKNGYESCLEKIRDIEIFKKYDFIKEDTN
jgi:hypothetical protein